MSDFERSLGERIKKLRKQLDLTQRQLAKRTDLSHHQTVSKIEKGERDVKASELSRIAKALRTSPSNLLMEGKISKPAPVLWRAEPEDKEEKEAVFRERCAQYHFLEELLGKKPTSSLNLQVPNPPGNIFGLAKKASRTLDLGGRPAVSLRQVLEDEYGVKIWYMDLGEKGSGACTYDKFGYGILINRREPPWRMNFSLAHELFHLLTWEEIPPIDLIQREAYRKEIELSANRFAANLLLPAEDVLDYFDSKVENGNINYSDLIEIARYFSVSTEALLWRLHNLNRLEKEAVFRILDDSDFREMDRKTMAAYWHLPPELPERFVRLAVLAYQRGKISELKLAELLDTSLFDLENYVEGYGMALTEDHATKISP